MMTSSNEDNFYMTGPLWGEFIGHLWIPLTKASDMEFFTKAGSYKKATHFDFVPACLSHCV